MSGMCREYRVVQVVILILLSHIVMSGVTMCAPQMSEMAEPPITLVYLDRQTILFECLNKSYCFQNINLDDHVESLKAPLYVGPVFYVNPSSIFITLSFWDMSGAVLNINPKTNQVVYLDLPVEIDPDLSIFAHDSMILANRRRGEILIIQDDLSVKKVEVGTYIIRLIEAADMKVIALSNQPIEKDGKLFTEAFIIDVASGKFTKRLLESPGFDNIEHGETPQAGEMYAGRIVNASRDLNKLYYLYYFAKSENKVDLTLGVFNTNNLRMENSISDPQCINMMTGYAQYHNVLYSSRTSTEGSEKATLINMSNLQPIVDLREIMQNELTNNLTITPFGDYFLLGTNSKIILLSPQGTILNEYPLPLEWINRDYVVMEYRK